MSAWPRFLLAGVICTAPATAQEMLSASEGLVGAERLGSAVARVSDLDGDGADDLAVGAADALGSAGGVVLVSSMTGARIAATAGTVPFGRLGAAIVTIEDVSGDGIVDIAVGEPGSGGAYAGAVRLLNGKTLALVSTIPGSTPSALFGDRVVSLDDHTNDGVREIAVASPAETNGAGAVRVIDTVNGTVLQTFVGSAPFDALGTGLGTIQDLSGDGLIDLVIGAPGFDPPGVNGGGLVNLGDPATGAVFLSIPGLGPNDALGFSCDGTPDINGDTFPDLVGGAPGATVSGMAGAGSCFALAGTSGTVIHRVDGLNSNDAMGWYVAGLGDLEGDGVGDYSCGSPSATVNGVVDAGRVYVVSGGVGLSYEFTGVATGVGLGAVCRSFGDLDGDTRADLVIGSPDHDGGAGADVGRVEIRRGLAASVTVETSGQYGSPFNLTIQATPGAMAFLVVDVASGSVPSPYGTFCLGFTPSILVRAVGPIPATGYHLASGLLPTSGPPSVTIYVQAVTSNPFPGPLFWTGGCDSISLF